MYLAIAVVSVLLPISCANQGVAQSGPQGGPKDTIPPVLVSTNPENKALNFNAKKIELLFDENLQMDKVSENVIISPPQRQMPEIKALGRKVVVQLKDSLRDSTTYTIDFGRSICDYHEKNPYPGFFYCFSTGDYIDTLEIAGTVYSAETLDPVAGVMVGIHSDTTDAAVSTRQFIRAARTDSTGRFVIRNIHEGRYRLYGLNDISKDYVYQPGEAIAYIDSTLSPSVVTETHVDTTWTDSISIDTIVRRTETYLKPDSVQLWLFDESKQSHYLQRCTREERHRILITFAAPQDSIPQLLAPWLDSAVVVSSAHNDTLAIWLPDSSLIRRDTLSLVIRYLKSDSLFRLVPTTDTLPCMYRAKNMTDKVRAAMDRKARERKLEIRSNASSKFGLNDTLRLLSLYPIDSIDTARIHLFEKIDSVYHPHPYTLDRRNPLCCQVLFEQGGDRMFELRIDSAAIRDIYGVACTEQKVQLRVRPASDYSQLTVRLKDFDPRAVLQLLDSKEKVIRSLPASESGALFAFIDPGTYYLRLFIDENGDGQWTSGDWATHRKPETICYFPSELNVRANWEFEEVFDHLALTPLESKPRALRKVIDISKKK